MILLPAIDMKDGRCVRLKKGEFHTVHQVANSALETARRFAEAGAQWVHMVDLDGARDGVRANFPLIYEVIQQSGLRVELGGRRKVDPRCHHHRGGGRCPGGHRLCRRHRPGGLGLCRKLEAGADRRGH